MMRNRRSSISPSPRGVGRGEFELDDAAQHHLPPTPSKRGRMIHDEELSIFHIPLTEGARGRRV
jgi:hypothetical protein